MTFVLIGLRRSGNVSLRNDLMKKGRNHALQALFPLRRKPLPARPGTSSSSSSLPLGGQGKQEGSQGAPGVVSGEGLPLLSLDLGPARGVRVPLGSRLGRAGALPFLLLLREWPKWELPARCRLPLPAPPTWLSLPNSHRTFHDMGIRERLRSLAPACYPPVVPVLRIEEHGRIREPGHVGVALVDVAVVLALAPLPVRCQEVESDDAGHRPRRSLFVPARARNGRGRLTATALGLDVTGLYPRIDTGHAVTALGVNGRGLLTATSHAVSVRVPLPAGEIGVTLAVTRSPESLA